MSTEKDHKVSEEIKRWKPIIKACIDNDRFAQETLYRHFFPIMERMVMKYTQDEDQIIDILNDGFLRVFQKIKLYEARGSFEGWIRKLTYHSLSNYFRKHKNDLKFLIYDDVVREPSENFQHSLYYQDLMSLVDNLPEVHMKVFHLFAIDGLSHKEISQRLKMNNNTCRWYLSEARKMLQEAYFKKFTNKYNEAG